MQNTTDDDLRHRHLRITEASPWVRRFAPLIRPAGTVLDLAAGGGRHSRHLLELGYQTVTIDRNIGPLTDLQSIPGATVIEADLEIEPPPFATGGALAGRRFDGIVVVNYLHRTLFDDLIAALTPGGVLIYETFARGHEAFARPRNPDHLLRAGELLSAFGERLHVVAYEHGRLDIGDIPGVKQRLCAVNDLTISTRDDGEPDAHPIDPK